MTKELDTAPGDIRSLKYRIHELEGEVIGYKRILDEQGKAKPVAVAHVGNMDHGPFDITPTAYGCDHLKNGDKLYTSPPDPGGLLRDALSNLNDLADQKNAEIDALKEAMRLALERMQGFALWADSQADAQSKGGHATFDIMELREQRDMTTAAIAAIREQLGETK